MHGPNAEKVLLESLLPNLFSSAQTKVAAIEASQRKTLSELQESAVQQQSTLADLISRLQTEHLLERERLESQIREISTARDELLGRVEQSAEDSKKRPRDDSTSAADTPSGSTIHFISFIFHFKSFNIQTESARTSLPEDRMAEFAEQLTLLSEMGFTDLEKNIRLLIQHRGNVDLVIEDQDLS
eukprot:c7515_g1_i2.p1 GENE.c7515_g1_i2~~c7515_g1_i2.p1  ORF type:complete len:185 (+),score=44.64 c7515_g1_i2:300-854(+)